MTDKLKAIIQRCECGVHIEVNANRDYHQSVADWIEEERDSGEDDISPDTEAGMLEHNTVVVIQAYPDTAIGFYKVIHFDLDKALDGMLETLGIAP